MASRPRPARIAWFVMKQASALQMLQNRRLFGLRFAHHIVHFAEQFIGSVRLADEVPVIGNFCLIGLYVTGSYNQEDVGPPGVNLSRKVHSVARARHLNVGKKQPHIVASFQQFQRGIGIRGFQDAKTIFFKKIARVHAQKRFVFDYEDRWLRFAH
jgi:hypothetical protein